MVAWSAWRSQGVLPAAGGWHDQTRGFVRLCAIADAEAFKIRRERERSQRDQAEAAQRRAALANRI